MRDIFGVMDGATDTLHGRQPAGTRRLFAAHSVASVPEIDTESAPRLHRSLVSAPSLRLIARGVDLCLAGFVSYMCLRFSGLTLLDAPFGRALPFLLVPATISLGIGAAGGYQFSFGRPVLRHMLQVMYGSAFALGALLLMLLLLTNASATAWPAAAALASWTGILALHIHMMALIRLLMRSGRLSENVVIVGATDNARRLIVRNAESRELNIVGVFDDRSSRAPQDIAGVPVLGGLDDLMAWDDLPQVDRIIVTVSSGARDRVRNLIDRLRILPQRVILLLDLEGFDPETQSLGEIAHSPAAYVSGAPRDRRRAIVKRASDILFASIMIILFSPILLAIAIAVRLDSPGSVFFRQKRHGFQNEIIRVWKFRSMKDNKAAEESMQAQTFANDPRVTRIGRFIRRTSLDELPQLLNVLKGEMSIVGPRPHAVGMTTEATEVHDIVRGYAHRHRVKPGITGWAQINGSRGPVHTKHEVRERIQYDLEYINRSSFWFDLYIMVMTAPCLLGDARKHR